METEEAVSSDIIGQRLEELVNPTVADAIREFYSRFLWLPDEELDALTIWTIHTWVFRMFPKSPRLRIEAEYENAGKTTVAKIATLLSKNGARCSNASMPSVYTIIDQEEPTIFFDETEKWLARSGRSRNELVGILEDAYEEEGYVWRQVDGKTKRYACYVACAFIGVGRLPWATLASRCVTITMRRKPNNVHLEKWSNRDFGQEAAAINALLESWTMKYGPELDTRPDMPEALGENREYDIWQPLVSIGDSFGLNWGAKIRAAALKMVCGISAQPVKSPSEELVLAVANNTTPDQFLWTGDLIESLQAIQQEDNILGWATWLNDPIVASRQIAGLLRVYGIESAQRWDNEEGRNRRGYNAADFHMWAERLRAAPHAEP